MNKYEAYYYAGVCSRAEDLGLTLGRHKDGWYHLIGNWRFSQRLDLPTLDDVENVLESLAQKYDELKKKHDALEKIRRLELGELKEDYLSELYHVLPKRVRSK